MRLSPSWRLRTVRYLRQWNEKRHIYSLTRESKLLSRKKLEKKIAGLHRLLREMRFKNWRRHHKAITGHPKALSLPSVRYCPNRRLKREHLDAARKHIQSEWIFHNFREYLRPSVKRSSEESWSVDRNIKWSYLPYQRSTILMGACASNDYHDK